MTLFLVTHPRIITANRPTVLLLHLSSSHGIFEDHPGLNPSSERIVELQSDIREKLGELMIENQAEDVMVLAEALHAESGNIPFLQSILDDLNLKGVESEAYKDVLDRMPLKLRLRLQHVQTHTQMKQMPKQKYQDQLFHPPSQKILKHSALSMIHRD